MKRFLAIMLTVVLVIAGCGLSEPLRDVTEWEDFVASPTNLDDVDDVDDNQDEDEPQEPKDEPADIDYNIGGDLEVWWFSDEPQAIIAAYGERNPDVNINFTMTPDTDDQFVRALNTAILSGKVPDVVGLEGAFVRQFVEMPGVLMDLSELDPLIDAMNGYEFARDMGRNPDGITSAVSYDCAPGGVFYRRSLAREYFGNDDPAYIQSLMSNMAGFENMAAVIKEKSGGNAYAVGSINEFLNPWLRNSRSQPWIVDGELYLDPVLDEILDTSRRFHDNNYELGVPQWGDEWFNSMSDNLPESNGEQQQIFSYFFSTWGLPWVLMPNSSTWRNDESDTAGDWALVQGPVDYHWGGTWLAVMNDAKNPETAKDFVKFATTDREHLEKIARGVYTEEYLKSINPKYTYTFYDDVGKCFMNSRDLNLQVAPSLDNSEYSDFLGGQNHFYAWDEIAQNTSAKIAQGTDNIISPIFITYCREYATGEITREEFYERFAETVELAIGD